MTYQEFLATKQITATSSGFEVNKSALNPAAFEWQRDVVAWALRKGRCALFEDCGMGKTLQQLMFAQAVAAHTGKPVLILAPLAVGPQTVAEGLKFGIAVQQARQQTDISDTGVYITNYEIAPHFDFTVLGGVVLDESSILKDFTSKTRVFLTEACSAVPYRLCCTATPSPNDYTELGNHAEFLGVMSRTEMLATFFVHDGGNTSSWRLKGHAKNAFFEWVASWACCMTSPADLGYPAEDYQLPQLQIHEHVVPVSVLEDADGQTMLCSSTVQTLSERRSARRTSLEGRVQAAAQLANASDEQCLLWCDLNDESAALGAAVEHAVEVRGTDAPESKVQAMQGFSAGDIKCLVSKPSIAGWGMNWQQCSRMIFVGLSDSFEAYYQAVRRCWRFGQKKPVQVHIVISDADGAVKANIEKKQRDAQQLTAQLVQFTKNILQADIQATKRISEHYTAFVPMVVPAWLEGAA